VSAVFVVGWGRLARSDWKSVLVKAHDPDEAVAIAAAAYPDRLRPEYAVQATPALEQAVLEGGPLPPFWRGAVLP